MKKNQINSLKFKKIPISTIFSIRAFILLFLMSGTISAQSYEEGASLGLKLSVNVTNLKIQEAKSTPATGFNLGLFSSAPLTGCLTLQPELNLNLQNSHISIQNESASIEFNLLQSYIEFVLSGRISHKKIYGQIGPYISYLANTSFYNSAVKVESVSRRNFQDVDLGFIYAAGIQLKRWDIGLRYNNGMFKTGKQSGSESLNMFRELKTSSFQLGAGYYF